MIKVWTDSAEAGLLDRQGERGSAFAYLPALSNARGVSTTMPVRLPSWTVPFGLPPIFEMNLPEGFLRERLRLAFAKATGTFDEFDLLSIVGRSQVGRIRYTGVEEQLYETYRFSPSMRFSNESAAATCSVTYWRSSRPSQASAASNLRSSFVTKRLLPRWNIQALAFHTVAEAQLTSSSCGNPTNIRSSPPTNISALRRREHADSTERSAVSPLVQKRQWRRKRDSNPRVSFPTNGFQDRRVQPLCHSSATPLLYRISPLKWTFLAPLVVKVRRVEPRFKGGFPNVPFGIEH